MKIFDYSSDFNGILLDEWLKAYNTEGIFKFKLDDEVPTKYLDGKFSFILQKNSKRYSEKRPTEIKKCYSINIPFDPTKFNFTKINPKEYLLKLSNEDLILVNNSPIEIGHCLICPKFNERKNQVLDEYSISLAVKVLDLTQSSDYMIGFNSIGAYASVNNLHLHFYKLKETSSFKFKLKYPFPIQNVVTAHKIGHNLYYLDQNDFYRPCFCVQFDENFCQNVFKITNYMVQNDIPHNIVFVKCDSFEDQKATVKGFIWPKISSHDIPINEKNLCFAICELSGHFISPNDLDYDTIDEDFILNVAKYIQPFDKDLLILKDKIINLFKE